MSRTLAGIVMAGAAVPGAMALPLPGESAVPPAVAVVQAVRAGCPQVAQDRDRLVTSVAISLAESNGRPEAEGDTGITDGVWGASIGIFQVRSQWAQQGTGQARDADELHDPVFNARSMCEISGGGENWRPWSVWLHGTYRDRLAEAEEAVDDPRSGATPAGRAAAPPAVATDPARKPSLVGGDGRLDEAYRDAGGWIDAGCEHVDGQPRLSAACAAAQRAYWGDQKNGLSPAAPPPVGAAPGVWLTPCPGPVTSGFGPRAAPIEGARTFHPGLDLACGLGTPAKASAGGTVIFAGWDGGFGNSVQVEHGGGTSTSYNHLSAVMVVEGQRVAAGATVGLVGSTGVSTGPHLHFELWEGGVPVDPTGRLTG